MDNYAFVCKLNYFIAPHAFNSFLIIIFFMESFNFCVWIECNTKFWSNVQSVQERNFKLVYIIMCMLAQCNTLYQVIEHVHCAYTLHIVRREIIYAIAQFNYRYEIYYESSIIRIYLYSLCRPACCFI